MISFSCHVLLTIHCQMLSPELRKSAFQASRACGSWGCGQILQAKTGWIEACLPCSPSREVAAEKEVNRGEGSIGETCRNPKMLIVFSKCRRCDCHNSTQPLETSHIPKLVVS